MAETKIFTARSVITMNPSRPRAEAVAVRGERIVAVGSVEELSTIGDVEVDDRFADHILAPGFVEAHSHVMSGGTWTFTYVGFFDRSDPNGRRWAGCRSVDDVVARLREVEATMTDPDEILVAWGLDPIYLTGERLVGRHLDAVSQSRPIFVFHASGHIATVNSELMRREDITADNPTPGIPLDEMGVPTGELQEPAAMSLARAAWQELVMAFGSTQAKWNYAFEARNTGHTFLTDLGASRFSEESIAEWRETTSDPEYPARVMVAAAPTFSAVDLSVLADLVTALSEEPSSKLHFGIVKLILDGSIQGFTARLSWPYYHNPPEGSAENGLWLIAPEQIAEYVSMFHRAGLTVHAHCNGDQTAEVFIDAVEQALLDQPRWDHRHTVQHCQLTTPAQYRRMSALGMCANIFSNHIFYWGDQHVEFTVGPERAARMDACATAEREGVSFSFHSDAPVTPLGHLHVMWCAVNRTTASGNVLGPDERISVDTAMRAATIDAAFQLKLDHMIGSIEAGKLADFAVLDDDPFEVDPTELKDIGVWGTVVGGRPFEAGQA
ncbi:MAG: amidohydrolase [Actinomycetia bacterium]|nr:amidohydrolase [Actinomycetes bacterium]